MQQVLFQGLSEDGTKYSSLLKATSQEKPNIQVCNVTILSNVTDRASVACKSFVNFTTSAFLFLLTTSLTATYETTSDMISTLEPRSCSPTCANGWQILHCLVPSKYSLDDTEGNDLIPMPYKSNHLTWSQLTCL